MPADIAPGTYRIVSLLKGEAATSVNLTRLPSQTVRLDQEVKTWVVRKEGERLLLSAGGYPYTGIENKRVTASIRPEIDMEWHATYIDGVDAYTIEPANDSTLGWTVSDEDSKCPEIVISLIIVQYSNPPKYLHTQLYRLVPVN